MKQVVQSLKTGELNVFDIPAPGVRRDGILVRTAASLVSAGTERMIVDFAEKNLLQKARSRPDLVRQTWDKAQREGMLSTLDAVKNRLDQLMPLGYSCAGTVIDIGDGAQDFAIGDRVACAGAGYAVHGEVVSVPKNLAVKLTQEVDFEHAAFATLGAIALQGIRLTDVKLGEVVGVIGLGLVGQLTVQMLKAAGCIVLGIDTQPGRATLAQKLGADAVASDPTEFATLVGQFTNGHGADAVLIAADTRSNEPVEMAGEIARKKGVVVAVGAVGMTLPRKVYYEKELDFRISMSYGPGRYDPVYEEKGQDYPYAYVRWTEQRNMEAFVELIARRKIDLSPLITHRFEIARATAAYELITGKTGIPFLGVLLKYPEDGAITRKVSLEAQGFDKPSLPARDPKKLSEVRLGLVGAGGFTTSTLLPAIRGIPGLARVGIASASGLSAHGAGKRFGFSYCATDANEILRDESIDTVAILTRHNLHARQVIAALEAGKNVFVEKPLCLTEEELDEIVAAYQSHATNGKEPLALMVGFNRRFAPFVLELKRHLENVHEPLLLNCRVNAGFIPGDHWTQDPAIGGGRLLGEGCHFIDLVTYLAASLPVRVVTRALPDSGRYSHDNLLVTIEFANGSVGTISYVANGDKSFGKELIEAFGGGLSARMDDYRSLVVRHGRKRTARTARLRQDKGHRAEWEAFVAHLTGKAPAPIAFQELVVSTRATLAAQRSLRSGEAVIIEEPER